MAKFLFVLTKGPEDPNKSTRCFQIAKVAKEEGHEVNIFLTDNAVYYAKEGMTENIIAATGDEMQGFMEWLNQKAVPIYV